jgi:hypothetical protein
LEPRCHVHNIAVQVGAIRNGIARIDADAEPNTAVERSIAIVSGNLLLYFYGAAHCPIDTVEHHKKHIARRVDDPSAMLGDRRLDDFAAQPAHPIERTNVVQANQAAVSDHVGMNHNNQLSPI